MDTTLALCNSIAADLFRAISNDVREDRHDEKWIDAIIGKRLVYRYT